VTCGSDGCGGFCGTCSDVTVVASFPAPAAYITGITYGDGHLWVGAIADSSDPSFDDKIFKLNPTTGAVVDSFLFENPHGLAFGGGALWVDHHYTTISKLSTTASRTTTTLGSCTKQTTRAETSMYSIPQMVRLSQHYSPLWTAVLAV
jgi:hypothetical protein